MTGDSYTRAEWHGGVSERSGRRAAQGTRHAGRGIRPLRSFVAAAMLSAAIAPALAYAETRVASVDLQRALASIKEGKAATSRIRADADAKRGALADKQQALRKLSEETERQRKLLTPDAYARKREELRQKSAELQSAVGALQADLEKKQAEEMKRVAPRMQAVIAEVAKARGIDLVLNENTSVLHYPPGGDLTDEVIRRYDAGGSPKR
jgi:outer membrane protein